MSIDIKMECKCGGSMQVTGLECGVGASRVADKFNKEHRDCIEKKSLVIKDPEWISGAQQMQDKIASQWVPKEQVSTERNWTSEENIKNNSPSVMEKCTQCKKGILGGKSVCLSLNGYNICENCKEKESSL